MLAGFVPTALLSISSRCKVCRLAVPATWLAQSLFPETDACRDKSVLFHECCRSDDFFPSFLLSPSLYMGHILSFPGTRTDRHVRGLS